MHVIIYLIFRFGVDYSVVVLVGYRVIYAFVECFIFCKIKGKSLAFVL